MNPTTPNHTVTTDQFGNTVVTVHRNGTPWNRATIYRINPQTFNIWFTDGGWATRRSLGKAIAYAVETMTPQTDLRTDCCNALIAREGRDNDILVCSICGNEV